MWKFFAFVMVVLLILMFIQISTLSDEEVARIRAQVEAQNKQQANEVSQNKQVPQSQGVAQSFLSMPSVMAYEEYLNAIPDMAFYSEADKFINPAYSERYKEKITAFNHDELTVLKDLHDLTAMEYMRVETTANVSVVRFIASSKLIKLMIKKGVYEKENVEGLVECTVVMELISGNWFINSENWDAIPETYALSESGIDKRTARLAEYRKKRNIR